MKLALFRKSPYERLVVARSNGAGEVARRGVTTMMERNKLARQDEAESSDGSNWSLLEQRDSSNHTTSDAGSGSSSADQGSSSNVGADGSSSSKSDSSGNTAASPAPQGSKVQDGGRPVPIVQSAPANSVSQGPPAEQPTPTAELPQPTPSPPAPSSQSSQPVDVPPPVAAPTSTPEVSSPSPTEPLPLTSPLPVDVQKTSDLAKSEPTTTELPPPAFPTSSTTVSTPKVLPPAAPTTPLPVDLAVSEPTTTELPPPAFPTSSTTVSTPEVLPPAAPTSSPPVDLILSSLSTTSAETASPPAAATTSLTDLATTSTGPESTSTTDLAGVQEATTDSVSAQTTISSKPTDVVQTATPDSVLTTPVAAALPPVAVQNTAGKDTATSRSDSKASSTSNPSPPPGVTSLPPALAPFTHSGDHTSLPPAAAPSTNKKAGSSTPAIAVNAHLPLTSSDIVHEVQSGTSSAAAATSASLSLQKNRPSGFLTSITPIQVADSLPTTANNGISSNQGSGSGSSGKTGTGGNDVNGPNGNGISASIQDHSAMSKTTQAVGFTFIAIGSIALVAGIIYLIRRVLRQRRLGKAYSPPSSPLMTAISDPLPSGIERSMSERSAMGTGKSEFWSTSDSNTMIGPVGTTTYPPYRLDTAPTYGNENGMYRSELTGNVGGGEMGAFGVRTEVNGVSIMRELDGQPKVWNLDSNRDWDEKMDVSPLSPTWSGGVIGGDMGRTESVRVDGMRFEMVGEAKRFEMPGDTEFKPNEKPLRRRGGLSEDSPKV